MVKVSGIYSITNTANDKVYLGSSNDIRIRRNGHISSLGRGIHHNTHLQSAYNKYGKNAFRFSIVDLCDESDLFSIEQQYLNWCKEHQNRVYNTNFDAFVPSRGRKCTQETRDKISKAKLGTKLSPETKAKVSMSLIGNKRGLGYKHTEETKQKISAASIKAWSEGKHL